MMAIKLFAIFLFLFLIFPTKVSAKTDDKFVTLVYPVRNRDMWGNNNLNHLDDIFKELKSRNFKSTWLLQYDTLKDKKLIAKLKGECPKCEFGLFMEVSEDLATDSKVSYKIGQGHWYRPDKIFLSGYTLLDREKLIKKQFDTFKANFGQTPLSVGAWYVDPFSLRKIVDDYAVTGFVGVADQHNTDGQRYWGKPFGTVYYPQKLNSLAPANSLANKLDLVEIQWAQRHPTDSWGSGPQFSQFSLQANDYINNKRDTNYFINLANIYFNSDVPQITVGLEVGQELLAFWDEHVKQLDYVANFKTVTMSEFSDWYKKTYPGVSPKTTITDGVTTWVNDPCYRAAYKNGNLFDLRSYEDSQVSPDLLYFDDDFFIDREIKKVTEIPDCSKTSSSGLLDLKTSLVLTSEKLRQPLTFLKWSTINGSKIVGLQKGKETIFGFWQGKGIGTYNFPFQTLSKFRNL